MILFSVPVFSLEKYSPTLSKEHSQKVKRIVDIIAVEVNKRGIKTIEVKEFTDIRDMPSAMGKETAKEFERQLSIIGGKQFSVTKDNADAVITGTLMPFKGKEKWQLKIKVISAETGEVITAYTGILKKTKGVKK